VFVVWSSSWLRLHVYVFKLVLASNLVVNGIANDVEEVTKKSEMMFFVTRERVSRCHGLLLTEFERILCVIHSLEECIECKKAGSDSRYAMADGRTCDY
jgi:hypothetical protein